MTQTTKHELKVAISDFHNGQIVYPVVAATTIHPASAKCHVDLYWHDSSDGGKLRPASFDGTRRDAESWLIAQGVHLDAQGIH